MIPGVTNKELIELRIRSDESIIMTSSRVGIEKENVFDICEKHWQSVLKVIEETKIKK